MAASPVTTMVAKTTAQSRMVGTALLVATQLPINASRLAVTDTTTTMIKVNSNAMMVLTNLLVHTMAAATTA